MELGSAESIGNSLRISWKPEASVWRMSKGVSEDEQRSR